MWKAVFDSKRLMDIFVEFYKIFNINISIFEPPLHVADLDAIFNT